MWESQGWTVPRVIEEYSPDRTILKLSFVSAKVEKAVIKSDRKKVTEKTQAQKEIILSKMQPNIKYKVEEVAVWLEVGRTRNLLKLLVDDGMVIESGTTKIKRYQMKEIILDK